MGSIPLEHLLTGVIAVAVGFLCSWLLLRRKQKREIEMKELNWEINVQKLKDELIKPQLEEYNINQYTLFQSEDSLVRAMGLRAFDLCAT